MRNTHWFYIFLNKLQIPLRLIKNIEARLKKLFFKYKFSVNVILF